MGTVYIRTFKPTQLHALRFMLHHVMLDLAHVLAISVLCLCCCPAWMFVGVWV